MDNVISALGSKVFSLLPKSPDTPPLYFSEVVSDVSQPSRTAFHRPAKEVGKFSFNIGYKPLFAAIYSSIVKGISEIFHSCSLQRGNFSFSVELL